MSIWIVEEVRVPLGRDAWDFSTNGQPYMERKQAAGHVRRFIKEAIEEFQEDQAAIEETWQTANEQLAELENPQSTQKSFKFIAYECDSVVSMVAIVRQKEIR